ncbi:hypothetical protein PCYB_042020 [Plasmodium cynomolgi strain B]|uniref:RING-type domain-containing protein n=1 Tax=Plasmodium cynomolgi (strain B) TaxID=1120755 RepID=K6USQ1_PLACD|nr:hypothetical protein PCYB_042020 [Plasmodium cynomolgi strain B]GAB65000.1 hypothetical protein PCYB_042020 [Plasmodium cynomolgi strain B]
MKHEIEKKFASRIFNSEELKVNKKICSFDNLLEMLKEGGVVSEEVLDFCIRLSLLSNKCQVIRTYVVYNYVGLVKILKKRRKRCWSDAEGLADREAAQEADREADQSESRAQLDHLTSAPNAVAKEVASIVATYSWCLSDELPQLITSVNIISDEFMQQLCNSPVTSEKYTCPICLCLIHDPVTLNSCFHSFCWNCLATAIQKYSIDNCPSCRTKIVYDRDSFKIDGILYFDDYLTVLNSIDKNEMEDMGRESDCCSDEYREGAFPQSDRTKLGPKGGAQDASYRLVSDVISYAFS